MWDQIASFRVPAVAAVVVATATIGLLAILRRANRRDRDEKRRHRQLLWNKDHSASVADHEASIVFPVYFLPQRINDTDDDGHHNNNNNSDNAADDEEGALRLGPVLRTPPRLASAPIMGTMPQGVENAVVVSDALIVPATLPRSAETAANATTTTGTLADDYFTTYLRTSCPLTAGLPPHIRQSLQVVSIDDEDDSQTKDEDNSKTTSKEKETKKQGTTLDTNTLRQYYPRHQKGLFHHTSVLPDGTTLFLSLHSPASLIIIAFFVPAAAGTTAAAASSSPSSSSLGRVPYSRVAPVLSSCVLNTVYVDSLVRDVAATRSAKSKMNNGGSSRSNNNTDSSSSLSSYITVQGGSFGAVALRPVSEVVVSSNTTVGALHLMPRDSVEKALGLAPPSTSSSSTRTSSTSVITAGSQLPTEVTLPSPSPSSDSKSASGKDHDSSSMTTSVISCSKATDITEERHQHSSTPSSSLPEQDQQEQLNRRIIIAYENNALGIRFALPMMSVVTPIRQPATLFSSETLFSIPFTSTSSPCNSDSGTGRDDDDQAENQSNSVDDSSPSQQQQQEQQEQQHVVVATLRLEWIRRLPPTWLKPPTEELSDDDKTTLLHRMVFLHFAAEDAIEYPSFTTVDVSGCPFTSFTATSVSHAAEGEEETLCRTLVCALQRETQLVVLRWEAPARHWTASQPALTALLDSLQLDAK